MAQVAVMSKQKNLMAQVVVMLKQEILMAQEQELKFTQDPICHSSVM